MSAFHFDNLMPELILDALASVGLYLDSGLTALNSYENRVYQFRLEDGQRCVAKFYRPERWSLSQLQEEHALAYHLAAQEVAVAVPLQWQGSSLHQYGGYVFAVWPSLGGRHVEPDNLDQLEAVGHQLGLWHASVTDYTLPARGHFSHALWVLKPIEVLMAQPRWPASMQTAFAHLLAELAHALKGPLSQPWPQLALHGDCHLGNILWREGPLLVDLDDCRMGPAMQDLWMLLAGDESEQRLQLDALLSGYEEFTAFDHRQLALIEPLRTTRMISHLGWLSLRWGDPAFPAAFPWFATENFWVEQYRVLSEQCERLKAPPISLTSYR